MNLYSDYLNKVIVNRHTYDSLNRIIQVVQSCDMNSTTSYLYDSAGNRIQKTKDSLVRTLRGRPKIFCRDLYERFS